LDELVFQKIQWIGDPYKYRVQKCTKVSDRGNYQITAGLTCSQCQDHGGVGDDGLAAPQFSVHTAKYEEWGEFKAASAICRQLEHVTWASEDNISSDTILSEVTRRFTRNKNHFPNTPDNVVLAITHASIPLVSSIPDSCQREGLSINISTTECSSLEHWEAGEILLEQSLPSLGDELDKMMDWDAIHLDPFYDADDDTVLSLDLDELQQTRFYNHHESSEVEGNDITKNGESRRNAANRTSKCSSTRKRPMRLEVLRGKRVAHLPRSLPEATPVEKSADKSVEKSADKSIVPRLVSPQASPLVSPQASTRDSPSKQKKPKKKKCRLLDNSVNDSSGLSSFAVAIAEPIHMSSKEQAHCYKGK